MTEYRTSMCLKKHFKLLHVLVWMIRWIFVGYNTCPDGSYKFGCSFCSSSILTAIFCFVLPLLYDMNVCQFGSYLKAKGYLINCIKALYIVIFALLSWLPSVSFGLGKTCYVMLEQHLCRVLLSAGRGKTKYQPNIFTVKTRNCSHFLSLDHSPWQWFTCCYWSLLIFSICHYHSLLSGLSCIFFWI